MYLHHGIALVYMHLHKLLKYQHVLVQAGRVLVLLQALFDDDVVKSSHDQISEWHDHYHLLEPELRHGVVFVGSVPCRRCHHQTTFLHHAVLLELIQVVYQHAQQYAYHDHHRQKRL
ncbi:hypothetical protein D3C71_1548590 [compost metagenome]